MKAIIGASIALLLGLGLAGTAAADDHDHVTPGTTTTVPSADDREPPATGWGLGRCVDDEFGISDAGILICVHADTLGR